MKQRRKRPNWPLATLVTLSVALGVIYVAAVPTVWYWLEIQDATPSVARHAQWVLADSIRTRLFELLIYLWVFMFGASIGSFLNVVIYRVPRRMSLLGGSKCPFCRVAIHGYDNVPVFAWAALGGRCRSCRLPISIRYPLVELAVGLLFLTLATLEVFHAGVNLPMENTDGPATLGWFIGRPQWGLLAMGVYHCFLLCVLFSWAWIQADRRSVPLSYVLLVVIVGFIGAALQPDVHPVDWSEGLPGWMGGYGWIKRFDTSLAGFTTGAVIGLAVGCLRLAAARLRRKTVESVGHSALLYAVVGLYLGWQATVSAALLGLVIEVAYARLRRAFRGGWKSSSTSYVFLAALLQILFWRLLVQLMGWPFPGIEV